MALRCLIVDDSESFLAAARDLLERGGLIIEGVASTSAEALERAAASRPDVVLVDIFLGEESGFDLARRLVEQDGSRSTVILISTHSEADLADLIAASPAAGFVPKAELSAAAVKQLANGHSE